ncbi:hypothetical protein Tco_0548497 [Tanacetum coccineum]
MSKSDNHNEEDEEDCFHESLDRILSSTTCSSSSSSSDNEYDDVSPNYDVWISQPSLSVEERRLRLLRRIGLGDLKLGKSVSADQLDLNDDDDDVISRVVVRSKSVDDHDNIRLIVDNNNENVDNNNNNIRNVLDKSPSVNGKPPTGKGVRRSEEIVNVDENVDCMIKNLDNGEEFV